MTRCTLKRMNNFTDMTKRRLNRTMFFVLVTAVLSMQWSSAHIHLAEHHDHGGNHHQHEAEAHAHQSITQEKNSNSFTHPLDNHNVNVVEIDHQCNTKNRNHLNDPSFASPPGDFDLNVSPIKNSNEPTELKDSKHRYIDYSTIYGRAPPRTS